MNSHLHLALLGMYEMQPSAVKNAAVTAASLLGTGRRRYWEVDMPKLHEDGKDEILGTRERESERESARAGRNCLSIISLLKGFLTCLRYLAVCAWRSPVRLPTLKSSNLH